MLSLVIKEGGLNPECFDCLSLFLVEKGWAYERQTRILNYIYGTQ